MSVGKDLVGSGCGHSPAFTWSWGWGCNLRPPAYKARILKVKNGYTFSNYGSDMSVCRRIREY